jgi:hypothetical protein
MASKPRKSRKGKRKARPKHSVAKEVRAELKRMREHKFIDVFSAPTTIPLAGTTGAIVNIPQGNGNGTRVGDELEFDYLELHLNVAAYNSDVVSHARVVIYQWKPNIALGTPTVGDILQNTTATWLSPWNYQLRDQYTVLYNRSFSLVGTATVPTDKSDYVIKRNVKVRRKVQIFEAASSSASSNTLCILYIGDSAVTPFPQINYYIRIHYTDS